MTRIKFALVFLFIMLMPLIASAEPVPVPMGDGSIIVVDGPASTVPMPDGATFLQQLWLTLQPILLMIIGTAVTAFVPLLMLKLNTWAKSKVHDARFHCAMDKLTQHAESAVLDVAQTYVAAVRREGKWSGDAAAEAKALARGKLTTLLGPTGLAEVKSCLGQSDAGLAQLMESALETALVKAKPLMGLPAAQAGAAPIIDVGAGQPAGAGASTK